MNIKKFLFTIFTLILMIGSRKSSAQESNSLLAMFTKFRDVVFNTIGRTGNARGLRRAAQLEKLQRPIGFDIPFPCNTSNGRSSMKPTSVHKLRPGDIDIVAAMGDSLTAGNGAAASSLLHITTENRGISWSIGGQGSWRQYLTLPNILKEFNPHLIGYSLADSLTHHRDSQFNVAEPGSMSRDMPYMARILVKRIKADRRVNVKNDWKLVTLMIGANDFCVDICYLPQERIKKSAETHRRELMRALDYLQDNLPRTLVNLVIAPSIKIVHDFRGTSNLCTMTHIFECPCMFGNNREAQYEENIAIQRQWQKAEEEVAKDPRYRTKSDFAVVMQPFTSNLSFPLKEGPDGIVTDFSYLSEDCFHFSQKGYARAANALWNNMLEPVNKKTPDWTDTLTRFLCPTEEHPYFYTMDNSIDSFETRSLS